MPDCWTIAGRISYAAVGERGVLDREHLLWGASVRHCAARHAVAAFGIDALHSNRELIAPCLRAPSLKSFGRTNIGQSANANLAPKAMPKSSQFVNRCNPSAPADAIDRPATIHRRSRPHCLSGRSACDRPRRQHNAGPRHATGGIANVLAVHHGAGFFGACRHEPGH